MSESISGETAYYLYDNEDILGVFDPAGRPLASLIHGPGIDEPLALQDPASGATYHYTMDGLGSIDAVTNTTSEVNERYRYSSFGRLTILNPQSESQSTSSLNPLLPHYTFTAREDDPESSLYFYRARYYDPRPGRFIQPDPLRILDHDLSDPDLNQYLYTRNNPINFTDPMGLNVFRDLLQFGTQGSTGTDGPGVGIGPGFCPFGPAEPAGPVGHGGDFETCYLFDRAPTVCQYMCLDGRVETIPNPNPPFEESCPNTALFAKRN